MLKRLLLLPLVGFVIFSTEAHAKVICDGYTPEIEVMPSLGHVEKDRSLRAVDLHSDDAWGDMMVDHIDGKSTLKAQSKFRIQKAKKGNEVCVILSEIKVLYKFDTTLQIIDDYPPDTCEYKQIMAHEEQHVAVAKDFVAQTSAMLQEYLTTGMKGKAGVATFDHLTKEAEDKLILDVDNLLQEYVRYLNQEHKNAQRKVVDTPDVRQKMSAACPAWQLPQYYMNRY